MLLSSNKYVGSMATIIACEDDYYISDAIWHTWTGWSNKLLEFYLFNTFVEQNGRFCGAKFFKINKTFHKMFGCKKKSS